MSVALEEWCDTSSRALDEIELAQTLIEGDPRGRRILGRQVNYAYAALIVAHFQLYCREVHSEATTALVAASGPPAVGVVLEDLLTEGRLLDRGGPTPGTLGRDFGRFGFNFWEAVDADDRRNRMRRRQLDQLCGWRNGIVHGDIRGKRASGRLVPLDLTIETCQAWRRALDDLVVSVDRVVSKQCQNLGCPRPW